jgi:hypothetical protein
MSATDKLTRRLLQDPLLAWATAHRFEDPLYKPRWKTMLDVMEEAGKICRLDKDVLRAVFREIRPKLVGPWTLQRHKGGPDEFWTKTSAKGTLLAEVYDGDPAIWVVFVKDWPPGQEPSVPAWRKPQKPRISGELPDLAEAMCFIDSLFLDKGRVLVPGVRDD